MKANEAPTLGQILDETARRDAVHVAVAPVVAYERLRPGEHVRFVRLGDTQHVYRYAPGERSECGPIGIVDPFLVDDVKAGQRFWLFLYPNTITSLRHMWTHPAFAPARTPEVPSDS